MGFEPNRIAREHIINAANRIKNQKIELNASTKFDVIVDGNSYPPKDLLRFAHEEMNGENLWEITGGEPTNKYLEKFGFQIKRKKDPILDLIQNYKSYISNTKMQDELYKWELIKKFEGRPDTNAPDFAAEYKAIKFGNLLYQLASAVGNHICRENPEEFRKLFIYLFDETIPLNKRVSYFNVESLKLYRSLGETLGHHQDERSISTYLTVHNPEKYTFYKSTFYKEFCKLMGVAPAGKNEKYVHYLELVNQFVENYIVPDTELTETVKRYIPEYYDGKNNLLLAQDILYCMLNKAPVENINYWRIGTKDDDEDYWEMMKSDNVVCIGWPNLGNLDDTEIENKKDIDELLHTKGSYVNDNRNRSRKALEIFNFYKTAKEGDVVLAQSGHTALGIGIVKDEYNYEIKSGFPHQRNVEWVKIFDHGEFKNEEGSQTTFVPLTGSDLLTKIQFYLSGGAPKLNSLKENKMNLPLNQILYGPPGSGKTYNSINLSLDVLGIKTQDLSRTKIKSLFDEAVESGQIVFTTFHQSMSYEDFIEGIKPKTVGTNVVYEIKNGIFKKIADLAKDNYELSKNPQSNFSEVMEMLKNELEESEKNKLKIETKKTHFFVTNITDRNIEFSKASGATNHDLVITTLKELFLGKRKMQSGLAVYYYPLVEKLKEYKLASNSTSLKNYVLIIDEINRGNVSQIFGELITLIEDGKRLGQDETITLKLPYSQEDFVVPPNLYIIGTMNTADRSVEALDTALRRRFSFEEMLPQPELIASKGKADKGMIGTINLVELLSTINERIEALVDRDHTIGHAFFMEVDSPDSLRNVFANKVIPLLQEYFYGDYAKMEMVIGPDFFNGEKRKKKVIFAIQNEDIEIPTGNYELMNILDPTFNFDSAINRLLNRKVIEVEAN